ncbi:MAG: protein kinase, partial [Myxococcota bacterium]
VLDFGIARIFRANEFDTQNPDQNRLTRAGEVFGTPAYLSPEQARGERDLTPASDLYSLGVMLFEMVEGQLPFWGDTALDTIMLHVAQPVPELTRLEAPQQLKALITSMMDKVAAKRPQTGREVAQALEHISAKIRAEPPSYPLALQPIEAEVSPPFKTLAHPPWPSASSLADPPGSTPSLDTNAEVERLPEGTTDSLSTLEELHDLDAPTAYAPRTLVALLLMPLALGAFVFVLFTQGDTSDDVSVEAKARAIGAEQSEALLQAEVTAAQTSPPNEDATQAQKSLPLAHEASANAEVTEQSAAPPEEAPRRPKKHPKTKRRGRDTLRRTKMDSELKEGDESAPKPPYRGPTRLTL